MGLQVWAPAPAKRPLSPGEATIGQRPAKQARAEPPLAAAVPAPPAPAPPAPVPPAPAPPAAAAAAGAPQQGYAEYARWVAGTKAAWGALRGQRKGQRAQAAAAAAESAAAAAASLAAAEAAAAAAAAAALALAAPLDELATQIGIVQLGDQLDVAWTEGGGDGAFYAATVVALTGAGVTVLYPESAEWDAWDEELAVSDSAWPAPADTQAVPTTAWFPGSQPFALTRGPAGLLLPGSRTEPGEAPGGERRVGAVRGSGLRQVAHPAAHHPRLRAAGALRVPHVPLERGGRELRLARGHSRGRALALPWRRGGLQGRGLSWRGWRGGAEHGADVAGAGVAGEPNDASEAAA